MYCQKCGEFFQPSPDEEKLMVARHLPPICLRCATEEWRKKQKLENITAVYPGTEYEGSGHDLYRAEWFDEKGILRTFISQPPVPIRHPEAPLRANRSPQLHVHVFSERGNALSRFPSEPQLTIISNEDRVLLGKAKILFVRKIPAFYDPLTGTDEIQVPEAKIKGVKFDNRVLHFELTDGRLLLRFR